MESGYRNMTETAIAKKVIEGLHDHLKLKRDHIGVIAPYRAQIKTLSDMLPSDVEVDTVDKFQGKNDKTFRGPLINFFAEFSQIIFRKGKLCHYNFFCEIVENWIIR